MGLVLDEPKAGEERIEVEGLSFIVGSEARMLFDFMGTFLSTTWNIHG
jgi:hypothetical protein